MVKQNSASKKRKAITTTTTTTTAATSSSTTRSSSRNTTTSTTTAKVSSVTPSVKKRKTAAKGQQVVDVQQQQQQQQDMFGKGKKSRQSSNGNKGNHIVEMFHSISEDPDDPNSVIDMEGIARLGEKIGIDATEDIRILVLLWKMDCKEKPGSITLSEWTNGCEALGIDSFESMTELLPTLELGFMEHGAFKDFYKFCFKFNLSGTHRTLSKEVVIELLQLLLKDRDPYNRVQSFCNFLQQPTNTYTCITMDQWCSFLDFNVEVGKDITNYDESTSAWPVLIDEFVDYLANEPGI